jgi:tetratricopeptide (TPR) repeat protein
MKKFRVPFLLLLAGLFACKNEKAAAPQNVDSGNPVIDGLTQKIAQNPNDDQLYYERGKAYYENEAYDQAIADLTKAILIDTAQPAYYYVLGDTYMDYFQSYNALKTMELAAARFPKDLKTLLKLSEYYHILKKYDDSFRIIDQILQQDPQNAEAYFMFGMNFKELGDTIRAINSFQSAVENDPDLVDAWIILGQLYAKRKDRLAMKYFDNALRADSSSITAIHAKAVYLNDVGKPQEALELYRKINRLDMQYEDAYLNAGLIYLEMDSVEKAYKQFDILVNISPINIGGWYYRGLASELKGDVEAAKQDYRQALKFAPNFEKAKSALAELEKQ